MKNEKYECGSVFQRAKYAPGADEHLSVCRRRNFLPGHPRLLPVEEQRQRSG